MWSTPTFDPPARPAEDAVLDAVSNVVVDHLRGLASAEHDAAPVLVHVDGPGKTQFLEKLACKLDPVARRRRFGEGAARHRASPDEAQPWTAVWFDAWQYQRVAPPWWWLMSALDKQLRARLSRVSWWALARHNWRDVRERLLYLARDLLWVIPGAVILGAGLLLRRHGMQEVLAIANWLVTAAGGIAAAIALLSSARKALRRHLLAESPRGTNALLRSSDPMEDLLRRYSFLLRSAGTPVIVLIDNLDRCRAEYVVEMLEGLQTLLRNPRAGKRWSLRRPRTPERSPLVAFVVAADRGWLCSSYLRVYDEFKDTANEPGRPFGLMFVDKIFDLALRVPTVPAVAAVKPLCAVAEQPQPDPFAACRSELEVRERLGEAELAYEQPVPELRRQAVMRLAQIELDGGSRQRFDTAARLDALVAELDPGPAVQRQLDTAYCVQRTSQLLGGHAIDADPAAIERLGLWTVLELRWPLLAAHLEERPDDVRRLGSEHDDVDGELAPVFSHPVARRLARGVGGVTLEPEDITRFTVPYRRRPHAGRRALDPAIAA